MGDDQVGCTPFSSQGRILFIKNHCYKMQLLFFLLLRSGRMELFDEHCLSKSYLWQEIARPQVHGYDMNAVAWLSPTSYVSAGDEKIARVFKATRTFFAAYEQSSGIRCTLGDQSLAEGKYIGTCRYVSCYTFLKLLPTILPAGVFLDGRHWLTSRSHYIYPVPLPTEDRLQQTTLWPEAKKLYGHAYEVYCLAAHPHLLLVASACLATKPQHAFIILWNGYTDWTIHAVSRLTHHQLTVTQLTWSPNGQFLLAVSRDRTWSVWYGVDLLAYPAKGKSHSRIIWAGAWTPDSRYFLTGSRDKAILVWTVPSVLDSNAAAPVASVPLDARHNCSDAVTALDVIGLTHSTSSWNYLVALGLESGQLQLLLFRLSPPDQSSSATRIDWSPPILFNPELCHVKNKRVRRLVFAPFGGSAARRILASAADDGLVRLFEVDIEQC
ncbi:unnamed protein product [Echinostoma caproni]|uniref:Elongator complex protein 2 n=1 Tax=Echinostoma caproni TaxID=27848 RepID=A0A3P8KA39_9TREM|nr:unnamed protein product [Echinostoma caproni]